MKFKYKLFLLFCFCIFTCIAPCYAIDDVVSFGTYNLGGTVQVVSAGTTFTVPIAQYIQGVLSAEIGSWDSTDNQEAFTAQAIAALTFLQSYNNNNIDP